MLHGHVRAGHAAREFFKVYDFDGDGFITREEWGGTEAVFTALDVNGAQMNDGANVQQWTWTGGNNQQWTFQAP